MTSYLYDRYSALFSRDAFMQTLSLISKDAGINEIYIVAHSLGNQIVVDALAHAEGSLAKVRLAELILAAPDVDRDVFVGLSDRLKLATSGITLYASSADRALVASRALAGRSRAGDVPPEGPIIIQGMETIDVTAAGGDLFALNHS